MRPFHLAALLLSASLSSSLHAADDQVCNYQGGESFKLTLSGPGLSPTVTGKINGTNVPMLIATGAYRSFLTARYVQALDIPTALSGMEVEAHGGEQEVHTARIKELSVGASKPASGTFPVIGEYSSDTPFALILGMDFLSQADLLFDLEQGFMQFFYPSNCKKDTTILANATVLDARSEGRNDFLSVTVKVNGVPMRTLINTSARLSYIDKDAAKRAGITSSMPNAEPSDPSYGVGNKALEAWFVPVAKMEIGKDVFTDLKLEMTSTATGGTELVLGADFLNSYKVLFARSQKKVYLVNRHPLKLIGSKADWAARVESKAAEGHPAAKSALASMLFEGEWIAKDEARAAKMMAEAAEQGEHSALMHLASEELIAGNFAKAASSLRSLSAAPGASRWSDVMAFLASAHNGDKGLATEQLTRVRKKARSEQWPMPVIDYLLDESDEKDLLRSALKQPLSAKTRECEAHYYIGQRNWLRGDIATARRSFDTAVEKCLAREFEHRASVAALKKLGT